MCACDFRDDLGFRIISEQVSHHPPVSAFHADSSDYIFHGAIHPKLKFWGKSVEVTPRGIVTLELLRYVLNEGSHLRGGADWEGNLLNNVIL